MMHPQPYGGPEFFARAPSSTMKEFTQAPRKRINEGLSPRRRINLTKGFHQGRGLTKGFHRGG